MWILKAENMSQRYGPIDVVRATEWIAGIFSTLSRRCGWGSGWVCGGGSERGCVGVCETAKVQA